jgi:hypothetical protein
MSHPSSISPRPRRPATPLVVLAILCAALPAIAAKPRPLDPPLRIPLQPLGFQSISASYLLSGASMVTVHYADSRHLLVTFGISRLMPRLTDCPPDDQDRVVKAVLLELPSGKELAHTEWRFHDLGQYLWDLGGGHFLLRHRDALTTFAPLDRLASGNGSANPFEETPFLQFARRIEAMQVSANHDLLTVETIKRKPVKTLDPASLQQVVDHPTGAPHAHAPGLQRRDPNPDPNSDAPRATSPAPALLPVEIGFYRLLHHAEPAPRPPADGDSAPYRILPQSEGRVYAKSDLNIPLTNEGFLEVKAASRDGVLLDFLTFNGKTLDLGDFMTSCPPRPTFVSPSEFVAFGCRGADDSLQLSGFNLRGDFIWQINFSDLQAYPSIVSAVPAGRFAFSRTVVTANVFGLETPSSDQLSAQEIRVIQTYNGRQLLKVNATPIQRAGQNFALAPDGLSLTVIHDTPAQRDGEIVHDTALEVYPLPPLSSKDVSEVKAEAALAPAPVNAPMRFSAEEIRAALAEKPAAQATPVPDVDSLAVGDAPPPAKAKATQDFGAIPASNTSPECATIASTPTGASQSCLVKSPTQPAPTANASTEPPSDPPSGDANLPRRKPPTLYEPAPADTAKEPQP